MFRKFKVRIANLCLSVLFLSGSIIYADQCVSYLAPPEFGTKIRLKDEIRRRLICLTRTRRDGDKKGSDALSSASKPFLGIRSMGLFAPLSYWRSETDWGIGDLDVLVDVVGFAKKTNQSTIQLLPLNIPLFDNSPYAIASTYVFDPVYIGIEGALYFLGTDENGGFNGYRNAVSLVIGLRNEIAELRKKSKSSNDQARELKYRVLRSIFDEFRTRELVDTGINIADYVVGTKKDIDIETGSELTRRFKAYCRENDTWLGDHLLYFMLTKEFGTDDFRKWPRDAAMRKPAVIARYKEKYKEEILFHAFLQWLIREQLELVSLYASEGEEKVDIMLDQPFAFGSADVWTNMDAFIINRRTLKRECTQGVPPHRLDVPQHWQFYLLNFNNPKARKLLLDRYDYLLRYCSVLRIDHLLGYYRLYYLTEDTRWNLTLQSMGIWDRIQDIFDSQLDIKEKRMQIYDVVIEGLRKHLPEGVRRQVFDESGALRDANVVLAARKSFPTGEYDRAQCGWYKQYSSEHEQDLLYTLLSPNKYGPDYLEKIIEEKKMFLQPADSIRVGYFNLGLGEDIVSAFMHHAQEQGKEVVFENLGVVPVQIEDSLRQLGACQFKPLFFGYQYFKGDHNQYWFDYITKRDYACFGIHDNIPVRGWWEGIERWAREKCYLKNEEQKRAVIAWLKEHGYLSANQQVDLEILTADLQKAVLESVADANARLVVFMMSDIFCSGDEGVINIPGQSGFWTARSPVTIEDLISAADEQAVLVNPIASNAVALINNCLIQRRQRNSFSKQAEGLNPLEPHLINVNPAVGPGYKQIAFKGGYFLVDAVVYGNCDKAEVVFDDGKRYEMQEVPVESGLPDNTKLFRSRIKVDSNLVKTNPFRIALNGIALSDKGYLIGLSENTDVNPLSDTYGQVKLPAAKETADDGINGEFLNKVFGNLKEWIKQQRWFLEKTSNIVKIDVLDYFEVSEITEPERSFGIVCDITISTPRGEEVVTYYIPLTFLSEKGESGGLSVSVDVDGREIYLLPAEHTLVYQKGIMKLLAAAAVLDTPNKNRVIFTPVPQKVHAISQDAAVATEDLLKASGVTTSNILTAVTLDSAQRLVVKTIKKGKEDTEAEMYIAAQGYEHIPGAFGYIYLEMQDKGRIPLCVVMEKLEIPDGLKPWEAKAGYNIWSAFSAAVNTFADALADTSIEHTGDSQLSEILDKEIFNSGISNHKLIENLAEVIAGFHIALARNRGKGFGIQSAAVRDIDAIYEKSVVRQIMQICGHVSRLENESARLVREFVADERDDIESMLRDMIDSAGNLKLSRIHGDMQLDQILFDNFYRLVILDLGGAPLQKLEERMSRTLTANDIAGLIRAFGYIKHAALKNTLGVDNLMLYRLMKGDYSVLAEKEARYTRGQTEQIILFVDKVEQRFREILVNAYMQYMERQNAADIVMEKWDKDVVRRLVEYCVIARALYEIDYELSVRPEENGAVIPLKGLQQELKRIKDSGVDYAGIRRERQIKEAHKIIDSHIEHYEHVRKGIEGRQKEQKKVFIDIEALPENQRCILEGEKWARRKDALERIFGGYTFEIFRGSTGIKDTGITKENTIILLSNRYEKDDRYQGYNARLMFIQDVGDEYFFPLDEIICLGISLLSLNEGDDAEGSQLAAIISRLYKQITQESFGTDDVRMFIQNPRLSIKLPPVTKYFDELDMYAIRKLEQYA